MPSLVAGSLVYNFDIQGEDKLEASLDRGTKRLKEFGNEAERSTKRASTGFSGFAAEASTAFDGVATGIGRVLQAGSAIALGGTFGFAAMATAAFDQVRQVENASFALKAYERDADKVSKTLSELVAFARSDQGVLFQRQELFKAASNLRGFGEESGRLTERVKVLARGVALGMTTFDELSQIVGRAAQAGQLSAEAFDQLAFRGIILDSRFRGAKVSTQELYDELTRVLPADLLEGRANTIDGVMIRLQSSFRDLGSSIIGVDKDTSTFIKGGLGDRFVGLLGSIRETLASPEFKTAFSELGTSVAIFAEKALPLLLTAFKWLVDNRETIGSALGGIAAAFVAARLAAIGFAVAASINPFTLIAGAVVSLIGVLTFLELRFGLVSKAFDVTKNALIAANSFLVSAFNAARDNINRVIGDIEGFFRNLPGRIRSSVGNFASILYNSGRDLINGLLDGAGSVLKNIGNFFLDKVPGWIKEPFKKALGIHSPSTVFAGYGANIGQGLIQGLSKTQGAVQNAIGAMGTGLSISPSISASGSSQSLTPQSSSAATSPPSGIVINLHMDGVMTRSRADMRAIAKDMIESLNEELRARRLPEIANGALRA